MPSASGIVADTFGEDRDRALAMFTSILPIGGIVGPVLGGVFVTYWSWRGIFLINVPIGLILLVLGLLLVPPSDRRDNTPVDVGGVVLLGTMIRFSWRSSAWRPWWRPDASAGGRRRARREAGSRRLASLRH
jgi:MFS family permease